MIQFSSSNNIARYILLAVFCICLPCIGQAQVIYQTTHISGISFYGNTAVTVTSTGTPVSTSSGCTSGPYGVSNSNPGSTEDYTFSFSTPTDHVRVNLVGSEQGKTYEVLINGQHYNVQNSELGPSFCPGCGNTFIVNSSGNIVSTVVSGDCFLLDINKPNIQSFTIKELSFVGSMDMLSFYFEEDSTTFINQPFIDTVHCPGATFNLNYTTNFTQRAGNIFTAQLSDAAGSFASPLTIGTRTATGSGAIPCTIPIGTSAGAGYRIRIVSSAPQDTSLDNQVNIRIKDVPANFSNGSNSPVCTGGILSLIGNTFTSGGVTWAWTGPNSFTANTRNATITNAAAIHAGDYILSATLNSSNCTLKDTTTVTITPLPNKPDANNNGPVCEGKALNLTANSTTAGVTYNWTGPAGYSNNIQNPGVSASATLAMAGDYIVSAVLNGCSNKDTTTVVVNPIPKNVTATNTTPVCLGEQYQLNGSSSTAGVSYAWSGPKSYVLQNVTVPVAQLNETGIYTLTATTAAGCQATATTSVVVDIAATVSIVPTSGTSICPGKAATFSAFPQNAGTGPTYQWRVNGVDVPGANSNTFSSTSINNGDKVTVRMTPATSSCNNPKISNEVTMSVLPVKVPSVAITANPNTPLFPNEPVTFTANPTDAGANPKYQWKRNGQNVGGATSATWGANANFLSDGDNICLWMKSDYQCPEPDTAMSNCIKVQVRVSVTDITKSNIKVYPNPVSEQLTIEGITKGSKIAMYDVVGREVLTEISTGTKHTINTTNLPAGNYVLQVGKDRWKVSKE